VANFLRLLQLPPRIQAALRDKEVAMGHARALITIDDKDAQIELLEATIQEDLSVREVERRVRDRRDDTDEAEASASDPDSPSAPAPAPERENLQLDEFRNRLRSRFSTQVQIRHKSDGEGRIELSYYSEEDLERLMELLLA
jgi:ParB family chromosome partitioning protein